MPGTCSSKTKLAAVLGSWIAEPIVTCACGIASQSLARAGRGGEPLQGCRAARGPAPAGPVGHGSRAQARARGAEQRTEQGHQQRCGSGALTTWHRASELGRLGRRCALAAAWERVLWQGECDGRSSQPSALDSSPARRRSSTRRMCCWRWAPAKASSWPPRRCSPRWPSCSRRRTRSASPCASGSW